MMTLPRVLTIAFIAVSIVAGPALHGRQPCPWPTPPPDRLPDSAREKLDKAFGDAAANPRHVWRDGPPVNADGTVNVYVEIPRGSSEKWEFDMARNRRELDRMVPAELGGYPTGYGFVPGTIGVDGDPFDGLVVGPPVAAGTVVRGHVLGFMHMTDEKGTDGKVVVTTEPSAEARRRMLDDSERARIASFFNRYKAVDDDKESFACVSGWGDAEEARSHVAAARRLFEEQKPRR